MGRQTEIAGNETTKAPDSSTLSVIGNSPDAVAAMKQKTGADEIVACGMDTTSPQPTANKYDAYTGGGYAPRKTNQQEVQDLLNQPNGQQPPKDVPVPTPAPTPVAQGCPTECKDVKAPDGYQVINQPLQPGQVMRTPDNWDAAGDQTNFKIGSDTINYGVTNAEDARGKRLQNDDYEQQIHMKGKLLDHYMDLSRRRSKAENFGMYTGAIGGLAKDAGYSANMIMQPIGGGNIIGSNRIGRGNGMINGAMMNGSYGYGGVCGAPYIGAPIWGGGGFGGGFGGGWNRFGGPYMPYANTNVYMNGQMYPYEPGGSRQGLQQLTPPPLDAAPYRKCPELCPPAYTTQPGYGQGSNTPGYTYPGKDRDRRY